MSIRTIMIFPEFENIDIINHIRNKYDPLANLVLPHITLVFPFDSELTNEELKLHLKECLHGIRPFALELEGFSKERNTYGNYLFITVAKGMEEITTIHDRLYTNELKQFDSGCDYVPHMTVGKVSSMDVLDKAFDDANRYKNKFSTTVSKISVEMIGEHEESIIIIEQDLN